VSALRALVDRGIGRLAPPRPRRLRRLRLPRVRPQVAAVALLAVALIVGAWLLLRDSSLFAVRTVTITGVTSRDAPRIRAALRSAAADMTTLHVRTGDLRDAVSAFPSVRSVHADADLPHGLTIRVLENAPIGVAVFDGGRIPVGSDGTLLRGVSVGASAPAIALPGPESGDRLDDPRAVGMLAVLAGAPPALRSRVARVARTRHGITLELRDGPDLYFGAPERLAAKWSAAGRVLADPAAAGATYLDLRVPERPAAGGLVDPQKAEEESQAASGGQPAPGSTAPGSTAPGSAAPGGAAPPGSTPPTTSAPATQAQTPAPANTQP
jgi:cell division protein FtsQ